MNLAKKSEANFIASRQFTSCYASNFWTDYEKKYVLFSL